MVVTLDDTTSAQISAALLRARRSAGSPTMGMVLTLIIVCDEAGYADALQSSMEAGREHPSRILLVVTASGRHAELDAEVRIGEGTPGEVVVIRMRGELSRHPASVIRPLLLPDSPVVVWWPRRNPSDPASDELAQLARRRITDASGAARPRQALERLAETYTPGDTDLTWTRVTPWRALLAAALDQYPARILGAGVEAERHNASAELLAAWLSWRLNVEVSRTVSEGPGITAARMTTAAGDIAITRPDGLLASYSVPGQPNRLVALKRRDITDLITEELRRMDPDEVFAATLEVLRRQSTSTDGARKRPATKASRSASSDGGRPGTPAVAGKAAAPGPVRNRASKKG